MTTESAGREEGALTALIAAVVAAASVAVAATAAPAIGLAGADAKQTAGMLLATLCLALVTVEVYGRGSFDFSGSGVIACGIAFGPGGAMMAALVATAAHYASAGGGRLHRVLFSGAALVLAGGVSAVPSLLTDAGDHLLARAAAASASGLVYLLVNVGLISVAMGLSEGASPLSIWRERWAWMTPYAVAAGPLGLMLVVAYDEIGLGGLIAFMLPPLLMMVSVRQYLTRTKDAVEETRQANAELAKRNDDLHELLVLAEGLASRSDDRELLGSYVEDMVTRIVGSPARVTADGTLHVDPVDEAAAARWSRIGEVVNAQLASALARAELTERLRKQFRDTIAALSRSMEAKDYYTGSHTERVSSVAVALGRRFGFEGESLDAIEIGALLHDIGKIGIPEHILHKPGPLDDEEWGLMKQHPLISEFILSEIDLPETVLQVARWSHERFDGAGYPDGLAGETIPLSARIVLVADAFDALTSDRSYRPARPVRAALQEIRLHAGTQFCPAVVAELDRLARESPALLDAGIERRDVVTAA